MIRTALVFYALLSHGVPADISSGVVLGSLASGVRVEVLAGYLVAGHPGSRYSGRCGDRGATCGPYRLQTMWPRRMGLPVSVRDSRVLSGIVAGALLRYSMARHAARCETDHDWRAHMKSGPGRRDSARAARKVRWQLSQERALCGPICKVLP